MFSRIVFIIFFHLKLSHSINPNHFHFIQYLTSSGSNSDITITSAIILQPLNHLSNSSKQFEQRFLYSEQYSLNKKTVFLYVSGAEGLDENVIQDEESFMMKTAKELGATVFALEHRFYGKSVPVMDDSEDTKLQYLNSTHAIRDVIAFIKYANTQFHFDPDVRWILWGAGYGGIIAAETRKLEPKLVSGVVTVSAPMKREFDSWKYNNRIERQILEIGGDECYGKIKEGFQELQVLMGSDEGRNELSEMFKLNSSINENLTSNNIQMFFLSVIAPFQQIVQYNGKLNLSILEMCDDVVLKTENPVERIHEVYAYLSKKLTGKYAPMKPSYKRSVKKLENKKKRTNETTIDPHPRRFLQYQMCTEFGWFYTTNDNENGLFGSVVPTSLFLNQCFDIFPNLYKNSTVLKIRDDIERARKLYERYNATNAVFINGANDPWAVLGTTISEEYSVVVWSVPEASHLVDFSSLPENVQDSVMENVKGWVNGPKESMHVKDVREPWKIPEVTKAREYKRKYSKEERFSKFEEKLSSKKQSAQKSESKAKRRFRGMLPIIQPDTRPASQNDFSPEHFETSAFRQRVDHFDNRDSRFFQQKFYKNSKFAKADGPNLLFIGGEGPETGGQARSAKSEMMRRAEKYGGMVYVLEHRFYGDSHVDNNTDLTYLSSLQALYDTAEFIRAINHRTSTSNPWITFGGSYPGMLSAWMRQLFPDLVDGAIASSAPVQAKTDFYEYHMVVENAFLRYNTSCYKTIKDTFTKLNELAYTEIGRSYLTQKFNVTPSLNEDFSRQKISTFFDIIAGRFTSAVQYAGHGEGAFTKDSEIAEECNMMMNKTGTGVDNLASRTQKKGINMDFEEWNNFENMKLWLWQTCTEFGFYQSTDSGKTIFGTVNSVSLQIQDCMDLFGEQYTRYKIDEAVERSNFRYGGADGFKGTNVVFTNGDVDPWHPLGILHNSTDPSVVAILINGTSHCADLQSASDIDLPQIKTARIIMDRNIEKWLKEAKEKKEGKKSSAVSGSVFLVLVVLMINQFVS